MVPKSERAALYVAALLLCFLAINPTGTRAAIAGPPPTAESFAVLPSVSLRYRDEGARDAPVIVLLHEMGMTLESWDAIVPDLTRSYRVIRYDLRGFGLSEKIGGAVSMRDEVSDLHGLLAHLGVNKRVALVGGAVGGAIALSYAAQHPDRVNGVVAISPAAGVADDQKDAVLASAARIERTGMRALLGDMEDIYPSAIRHDPARLERFRALQLGTDPVAMAATLRMIATTQFEQVLPRINCPVLLVAAELYPARSIESVKALAKAIPHGEFQSLRTGHFMALQSPELLLPVVLPFLHSHSRMPDK